jgi:hypothetical protein
MVSPCASRTDAQAWSVRGAGRRGCTNSPPRLRSGPAQHGKGKRNMVCEAGERARVGALHSPPGTGRERYQPWRSSCRSGSSHRKIVPSRWCTCPRGTRCTCGTQDGDAVLSARGTPTDTPARHSRAGASEGVAMEGAGDRSRGGCASGAVVAGVDWSRARRNGQALRTQGEAGKQGHIGRQNVLGRLLTVVEPYRPAGQSVAALHTQGRTRKCAVGSEVQHPITATHVMPKMGQ